MSLTGNEPISASNLKALIDGGYIAVPVTLYDASASLPLGEGNWNSSDSASLSQSAAAFSYVDMTVQVGSSSSYSYPTLRFLVKNGSGQSGYHPATFNGKMFIAGVNGTSANVNSTLSSSDSEYVRVVKVQGYR